MSDWLRTYYDDVDERRLEAFLAWHTEDVTVRFANNPPAHGREEVGHAIGHFWTMIGGLRHRFQHVYQDGDTTIVEADIDYTRLDGDVVTVPCTTVLHRRGELLDQVRIYLDLAPVFAPAAQAAATS